MGLRFEFVKWTYPDIRSRKESLTTLLSADLEGFSASWIHTNKGSTAIIISLPTIDPRSSQRSVSIAEKSTEIRSFFSCLRSQTHHGNLSPFGTHPLAVRTPTMPRNFSLFTNDTVSTSSSDLTEITYLRSLCLNPRGRLRARYRSNPILGAVVMAADF
jgi:hypothetical protein